jgi:hypothetical protein
MAQLLTRKPDMSDRKHVHVFDRPVLWTARCVYIRTTPYIKMAPKFDWHYDHRFPFRHAKFCFNSHCTSCCVWLQLIVTNYLSITIKSISLVSTNRQIKYRQSTLQAYCYRVTVASFDTARGSWRLQLKEHTKLHNLEHYSRRLRWSSG